MKIVGLLSLLSATNGFVLPMNKFAVQSPSALHARVDSSDAIKAALEASKKFGATSKEARIAWETVEEMDASDNSVAYKGGKNYDECTVDSTDPVCIEYDQKIMALSKLLEAEKEKIDNVKNLAEEIRQIKIVNPKISAPYQETVTMKKYLDAAKAATDKFGIESSEAKLAWEAVEDIASNDISEALKGELDDNCLVEVIEACEAMDELQRVISLEEAKSKARQA